MLKAGLATQTEGPGAAGEAAGPRFVPPPVGEIARLFPQLEILRLIGQGGMGAVYKARQPALDRFVALKVLPPSTAGDPGFAERFNREARALARLNHPNIVAVHDFGKAGTLHYLVMEFVDGANLREVERLGELTPEQALAIVPQICEALQFAHNEGIVHRDIKPENLLLDKKGRVKITDFGIAKMVGVGASPQNLTGAKDVVGTPHYMAPEQIEKPLSVDHRADIYSLGVVFYEMLTGELPLGKFQPPSKKVQIDVRLDEVVLHALEKEPNRRYQQASQVKTAVETIVTTPTGAGPVYQTEAVTTAAQIEAVRQRLKIPARGLIAAGVLQVLFALGLLVVAMPAIASEGGGLAGYGAVGFGAALLVVVASIVFLGANSMKKLRNYPFSVATGIVAAVTGPAAILGLPFGIWALVILFRRDVRAAFEANRLAGNKVTLLSDENQGRFMSSAVSPFRRGVLAGLWVFVLSVLATSIITFLLPKAYVGDARVKIISAPPLQDYNPYLVQNEIQLIRSIVVPKVADALNLSERWGRRFANSRTLTRDETWGLMEHSLDIAPVGNTILVDVRFYSQFPREAAEIANKIAEIYCTLPPGHRGEIVRLAEPPSRPVRPNVPLNILIGVVTGGVIGIFTGIATGLVSFWRRRQLPPPVHQPDRFWRRFAVTVLVLIILIPVAITALLIVLQIAAQSVINRSADKHKQSMNEPIRSDYIGQTWFPQGDSIEITSVDRTPEKMVVKGRYNLVSHDNALLALYITTSTNKPVPEDASQRMQISKGQGDFELIHPYLKKALPGLPHVSMYADGHPFASLYFGNQAEALEESKAGWVTNTSSASTLQFRLVLPTDSTEPADSLPLASGHERLQISREVLLDDFAIAQAGVDFSPDGTRKIEICFTDTGAKEFEAITATNIGHQLAIIFHGRVLSAPVIQSVITGGQCQVDGSMNASEIDQIVDCLNRIATPTAEPRNFCPVHEQILPFNPQPKAMVSWLDLDSGGVFLTNPTLDWQSRSGHDWIQARGLDVVTTESAKHFPTLLGIDLIIAPVPTNGWDITTPADVIHNWTLLREEPRQMQVFSAMPGQFDTFLFQTREGGKGILQILGSADNPPGVKVRYKLVQATKSREAIDPATGLPVLLHNPRTDPSTGLPLPAGATNIAIDSATGLPLSPGETGAIDPVIGLPVAPAATKGQ